MINGYILNIVGIVVLGVLINIILPSGVMSKYINSIFALIVVFVIISPIPGLLNYKFNVDEILANANGEIDNSFVYLINSQTVQQLEITLEKLISNKGYNFVDVTVDANIFETPLNLQKIRVYLANLVISGQGLHINKYNDIKQVILENVLIKEELIVFYEWRC